VLALLAWAKSAGIAPYVELTLELSQIDECQPDAFSASFQRRNFLLPAINFCAPVMITHSERVVGEFGIERRREIE
jgi:hypothetical protein